jgi:hypothetical protein
MPSVIKSVSFDAADALALARFWAAALGSDVDEDSTDGKAFVEAAGWGGPNVWFNQVPEPKTAKNRVHLDVQAGGGRGEPQEARWARVLAAVERLTGAGATVIREDVQDGVPDHFVMADPEGNEFCVV